MKTRDLFSILLVMALWCGCGDDNEFSESRSQLAAIKIAESICEKDAEIYIYPHKLPPGTIVDSPYPETDFPVNSPQSECWFFFIDDIPLANWGHPCRWVFVIEGSKEYIEYDKQWVPRLRDEMIAVRRTTPEVYIIPPLDANPQK